jgi:hypothetical protein
MFGKPILKKPEPLTSAIIVDVRPGDERRNALANKMCKRRWALPNTRPLQDALSKT